MKFRERWGETPSKLGRTGVWGFGVDAEASDGFGYNVGGDDAFEGQGVQGGDHYMGGVGFEMATKGSAGIGAAVTVGTQHVETIGTTRNESGYLLGDDLHEIAHGNDWALSQ